MSPAGTQRYQRTKMVVPLRVFLGTDESASLALAHTVDISPIGARLGGLRIELHPGQTITLQRRQKKANFRVVWSKQLGPGEIRAGIESAALERNFWGVDLPSQPLKYSEHSENSNRSFSPVRRSLLYSVSAGKRADYVHAAAGLGRYKRWMAAVGSFSFLLLVGLLLWFSTGTLPSVAAAPAVPWNLVRTAPAKIASARPPKRDGVRVIAGPGPSGSNPLHLQVVNAPQGHPIYPEPESDLTGKVRLRLIISKTGRVKVIQILSGNPTLAASAVEAVRHWRYTPQKVNGQPVEAETRVAISFLGEDGVSMSFPAQGCRNSFDPGCALRPSANERNTGRT